ncbi:unnamed protein product [Sphagnum troendelagicum]
MSTGANATPNGTHKVHKKVEDNGKGKDDGNKNAIVIVAGVVVASGIAFSVYKTFHKEDHPLVNTERGIKQDASNALDGTRVRNLDPDSVVCKLWEKEKVQDAGSHVYEQGKEAKKRIDGREIRVRKGDTLWGLSRRYGVSVESLKASNGILAGDYIAAGDTITVPY